MRNVTFFEVAIQILCAILCSNLLMSTVENSANMLQTMTSCDFPLRLYNVVCEDFCHVVFDAVYRRAHIGEP